MSVVANCHTQVLSKKLTQITRHIYMHNACRLASGEDGVAWEEIWYLRYIIEKDNQEIIGGIQYCTWPIHIY